MGSGLIKLREGNIENYLMRYARENIDGPKQSHVILLASNPTSTLKEILYKSLGTLTVGDEHAHK